MAFMEDEAMSFQPSGDFAVRKFGKTGPSDAVNARYAAMDSLTRPAYARPQAAKAAKPAASSLGVYQPEQLGGGLKTGLNHVDLDDSLLDELSSAGIGRIDPFSANRFSFSFSHGTDRVPGQGSGHVDTVPAMLAPGEAVLNRAAAENFGRGNIAQLNATGARQMGLGMHGSDEMNDFLRSQGIGVPPGSGQELRPAGPGYTQPPRTRGLYDGLPPSAGQTMSDPNRQTYRGNLPPVVGPTLGVGPGLGQPRQSPMSNLPPIPGQTMSDPNYVPLGVPPRNAPIPQVGMPEDPFNTAWGARPDPVAQAPMPAQTGWANPGAMNYGQVQQPGDPNMAALNAPPPPPASMIGGRYPGAPGAPVGYANPATGGRNGSVDPSLMGSGLGMLPPSSPSLGGERARGGLSAFEQAFSAARKAGKSTFPYNGGSYSTKRADGR